MAFITGYLRASPLGSEKRLVLHDEVYKRQDETLEIPAGTNFVEVDTKGMNKSTGSSFAVAAMRVSTDVRSISVLETYGDPRKLFDVYFGDMNSGLLTLGFSKKRIEKITRGKNEGKPVVLSLL